MALNKLLDGIHDIASHLRGRNFGRTAEGGARIDQSSKAALELIGSLVAQAGRLEELEGQQKKVEAEYQEYVRIQAEIKQLKARAKAISGPYHEYLELSTAILEGQAQLHKIMNALHDPTGSALADATAAAHGVPGVPGALIRAHHAFGGGVVVGIDEGSLAAALAPSPSSALALPPAPALTLAPAPALTTTTAPPVAAVSSTAVSSTSSVSSTSTISSTSTTSTTVASVATSTVTSAATSVATADDATLDGIASASSLAEATRSLERMATNTSDGFGASPPPSAKGSLTPTALRSSSPVRSDRLSVGSAGSSGKKGKGKDKDAVVVVGELPKKKNASPSRTSWRQTVLKDFDSVKGAEGPKDSKDSKESKDSKDSKDSS